MGDSLIEFGAIEPEEIGGIEPGVWFNDDTKYVACRLTQDQRHALEEGLTNPNVREVGLGGARGTTKTFFGCFFTLCYLLQYPGEKAIVLRKTEKAAVENIRDEFRKVAEMLDVKVSWKVNNSSFHLPNGAEFHIRNCANEEAYAAYQGLQYALIWFEEATQHTETAYTMLGGSRRVRHLGTKPMRLATANPGGIGDKWFIERFVNEKTRADGVLWVASSLWDSLPTLERNPSYFDDELSKLPKWKQQQWVEGRWDVRPGNYFDIPPWVEREVSFPPIAKIYAGIDWAYGEDAYAVVWGAYWPSGKEPYQHLHIFADLKGWRWLPDVQARKTLEREEKLRNDGWIVNPKVQRYGSWDAFKRVQTESQEGYRAINLMWRRNGMVVQKAKRTMRIEGWQMLQTLMTHKHLTIDPSATWLLDELQNAVQEGAPDRVKGEDIDERSDCDALDALRYMITHTFTLNFKPYVPTYQKYATAPNARMTKERK